MSTRRTEPAWREFERVVAMIEQAAAPRSATVKSPDRIRDLMTGGMREVDAAIRFRLGTVDILITIECQKRNRKANDTWIEQLATKRQKLGAAKTIAVSQKGFTRAAYLTAKHHGIELRTLSEIKPQDVEDWFLSDAVVYAIPEAANMRCSVRVEGSVDYIQLDDAMKPLFFHDRVVSPFPAAIFWTFHEMAHPRRFLTLPIDGSVTTVEFDIDVTKADFIPVPNASARNATSRLLIDLDGSQKVVTSVRIAAEVSINTIPFEVTDGVHHAYEGADGLIAQHTRFDGEVFGLPVTFDLAKEGGEVSGILEFPSGARLGLGYMASTSDLTRETCAFCDGRFELEPQSVLPDFLVPPGIQATERFLCANCAEQFNQWDAYAAEVWRHVPEDLTGTLHSSFSLGSINGDMVRLWLLSLVWRMGASRRLSTVDLREHASALRRLLADKNPGRPGQYPVICIALGFEGKRVDLFWEPLWRMFGEQRVLSVVFQGVLLYFLLGMDTSGAPPHISDDSWGFGICDWREVDFLVDAALKARAAMPCK